MLVIGGDLGTGGAALLSAEAALRCGAGMVTTATRPEHVSASLVRRPEVMCNGVESTYSLTALLERADVLVVGPGLGQAPWGRSLISAAAQRERPQVWDADALNLLATGAVELPSGCLITPHPGEAARLLKCSVGEVQADRPAAARALAQRYGCVALLRGRHAGRGAGWPAGPVRSRPSGDGQCRARRRAGRVLGALLAQRLAPFGAACLGAWLHAAAGERLGPLGRGLAASDLIPVIRQLFEAVAMPEVNLYAGDETAMLALGAHCPGDRRSGRHLSAWRPRRQQDHAVTRPDPWFRPRGQGQEPDLHAGRALRTGRGRCSISICIARSIPKSWSFSASAIISRATRCA